ncbi:MAG: MSMEG_1061 family FMN-dependent PPOX-type flavoprotein, partial [Planctomycetota bacterium]
MTQVTSVEQLAAIYGEPAEPATAKVTRVLTEDYGRFIQTSPFLTLATCGPEGLDCSPRGDLPGFVRIVSPTQLMLPDRRGNNRVDSLRNIVRDPRVALLFFLPGCTTTLRVNGKAHLNVDETLLQSFAVDNKSPRSVMV